MTFTHRNNEETSPVSLEQSRQAGEEWEKDDCSTKDSYFSVDSTTMITSNLPGARRLLSNLYSRLARSLENKVFTANARLQGVHPQEVGARMRGMAIWQTSMGVEYSLSYKQRIPDGEKLPKTKEAGGPSTRYTYISSPNTAAPYLPGPGRLLGNLYSRLRISLEFQGVDPQKVGMRIRGMTVWQTPKRAGYSLPFTQHVLKLDDLRPSDARMLRSFCRAIIYHICFGSQQTVTLALQEMISLSIRYFPVREAFLTVGALDALRALPLCLERVGYDESQQFDMVESLIEKAQLCLQDNAIYSACRESFLAPSCIAELDAAKLCLVLESFTDHGRLHFIATDLLLFFQFTMNESDARSLSSVIECLPVWLEYEYEYLVGIQDMHEDQSEILKRHCQALVDYVRSRITGVKVAALGAIIELSRQYRSIREALKIFDAVKYLIDIKEGTDEEAVVGFHQLDEIHNLASEALFSLQDNPIYDIVKESALQKPWAPEVEGAVLRLQLENYLFHPKLKTIAAECLSLFRLTYTFDSFVHHARHLLDPPLSQYGESERDNTTIARVACALVQFATGQFCGPEALQIRVKACSHIENMIFSHRSSRTYFNDADLSGNFAKVIDTLPPPNSRFYHESREISLFLKLSDRITLCLQDHRVFPQTSGYVFELDNNTLDTIFNYLRTPELFFIGAKALSKSWSKEFHLSNPLFCRIVCFLLNSLEEIAKYSEAEILVVTALEKILFVRPILELHGEYLELVEALSSPKYALLYPVAYRTIQEYRHRVG